MKILLITDNHIPHSGGAEKYFFTLKEKLSQHKNIQVYSLGFGPQKITEDDFITLKETSSMFFRLIWRLFFNPLKYWQLRKIIKKIDPDVIHIHNVKKYTIALLHAIKGYPAIQTTHDFSLICPTSWNVHQDLQPCPTGLTLSCLWQHRRNLFFPVYFALLISFLRMKHLVKKRVQHFLPPSPLLGEYLKKNSFQNVTFIFPFQNKSNPPIQPTHFNHFLFLGQLGKHKGIDILLEEFILACKNNPNLKLTLAGQGKKENDIRKKIKELNLDQNIQFIHWKNDPTQLYKDANAIIFPSIGLEAFGLVITEAMSHARPVIGSHRGPTPWLVDHEKTGLLFDPLKKGDLANCILKLANNTELAKQYGMNAYQKFKTFPSNEEILNSIIKIYSDVKAIKK